MTNAPCELCAPDGGQVLYRDGKLRVVLVDEASYPGFCRVVWNGHVKEMTDLAVADRSLVMRTVCQVEEALREIMQPEKINLASLGNMTPHLHWHVIPRYVDDVHFPHPIWAASQRTADPVALAQRLDLLPKLAETITRRLDAYRNDGE